MARNNKKIKELKKLNRYFVITKVFLAITPFICYLYIALRGIMVNLSFQQVLQQEPSITIIFLIAMMNPYIAYIIHLMQKHLQQGDKKFACINMGLLLIAQILTLNVFYFVMLLYVFYRAIQFYDIEILKTLKKATIKQMFYCGGGSMLVMLISCISLFATIKLK